LRARWQWRAKGLTWYGNEQASMFPGQYCEGMDAKGTLNFRWKGNRPMGFSCVGGDMGVISLLVMTVDEYATRLRAAFLVLG
jgi:hypothetical protein